MIGIIDQCRSKPLFNGKLTHPSQLERTRQYIQRCRDLGFRPFLALEFEAPSYCIVVGFDALYESDRMDENNEPIFIFSKTLVFGYHAGSGTHCLHHVENNRLRGYTPVDKFPTMKPNMCEWFGNVFGEAACAWLHEHIRSTKPVEDGEDLNDYAESIIDEMLIPVRADDPDDQTWFAGNACAKTWTKLDAMVRRLNNQNNTVKET